MQETYLPEEEQVSVSETPEETQVEETTDLGPVDPPSKKLWNALSSQKYGRLYTKSYDDFKKQFSSPETARKLHATLSSPKYGFYTKSYDDFEVQFFPELKKKVQDGIPENQKPLPNSNQIPPESKESQIPSKDTPVMESESSNGYSDGASVSTIAVEKQGKADSANITADVIKNNIATQLGGVLPSDENQIVLPKTFATNPNAPIPASEEDVNAIWNNIDSKEETQVKDLFAPLYDYDKNKSATKTSSTYLAGAAPDMGGDLVQTTVPDDQAIFQANQVKNEYSKQGLDINKLTQVQNIIDKYYSKDDADNIKARLNYDFKYDRPEFDTRMANILLKNKIDEHLTGHRPQDEIYAINNSIDQIFDVISTKFEPGQEATFVGTQYKGDKRDVFKSAFNNLKQEIEFSNLSDDEKRDIYDQFSNMAASHYGDVYVNHPEFLEADPLNKKLSEEQLVAYRFISDLHPEEINKYNAAFISDQDIKDNWTAQMQKQNALKSLTQIGVNLIAPIAKSAVDNNTPELNRQIEALNNNAFYFEPSMIPSALKSVDELQSQIDRGQQILNKLDRATEDLQDDSKYGYSNYFERQNLLQEVMGQKNTGLLWGLKKLGAATYNTAMGVVDLIKSPFLSDKEQQINLASLMGANNVLDSDLYVRQKNTLGSKMAPAMTPEFKAIVEKIKNDPSLTEEQKNDKVYQEIINNPDGIKMTPKGQEWNVTLNSLWYGTTGLAADLVPYIVIEWASGGGATGEVAPAMYAKFSRSFVAAFTTGIHQSLLDAYNRGVENPYADAIKTTTISSIAMAGAGTPELIKKIAGTKTVVGKLINKMTDSEILASLRRSPKSLTVFKKSLNLGKGVLESAWEGGKGGAKFLSLTTAAQALNDKMHGNVKDFGEYLDDAKIELLKFTAFGTVAGALKKGFTEKILDVDKANLFDVAQNPKKILDALEKRLSENRISNEEADQIKRNVDLASKLYGKMFFFTSKGEPLTDRQKRDLLFLKMQEADLERFTGETIPEKLNKSIAERLLNIKESINDIYDGNYVTPEQKSVYVRTTGEIMTGDVIKNLNGDFGQVVEINDNGSVVVKSLDGNHSRSLWKPENIDVKTKYTPPAESADNPATGLPMTPTGMPSDDTTVIPVVPEQKEGIEAIDQAEVMRQMKPITDGMADVERQFKNEGYDIDWDYDNEIQILDKDGEQVGPEDLPENLRKLAGQYEYLTSNLGDFDQKSFIKSLNESRKVVETEAEVVETKPTELPEVKPEARSFRNVELNMRYPERNEIIYVSPEKLLDKHAKDNPDFDIQKKENQIGNRVQKAKDFILNYISDQRPINQKTGERMSGKVSFEPSVVSISDIGKIGFEDGRHRVLAAKELGIAEVPIEVPKEQAQKIKQLLKSEAKPEVTNAEDIEAKKEIDFKELKKLTDRLSENNYAEVEGTKEKKDQFYSEVAKRYLEGDERIIEVVNNALGISELPQQKGEVEAKPEAPTAEITDLGAGIKNNSGSNTILPINEINNLRQQKQTDLATGNAIELENKISKEGLKEPVVITYYPNEGKAILTDGHTRLDVAKDMGAEKLPIRIVEKYTEAPSNAKNWNPPSELFQKAPTTEKQRVFTATDIKENENALRSDPDYNTSGYPDSFVSLYTDKKTLDINGYEKATIGDIINYQGNDYVIESFNKMGKSDVVKLLRVDKDGNVLRQKDISTKPISEIAEGQTISFKDNLNQNQTGEKVNIPGFEGLDIILIKDGMVYKVNELSTGMQLADSGDAFSKEEAIANIAKQFEGQKNLAQKVLNKIYQANQSPTGAGKYKVQNVSEAYENFVRQKEAEKANVPYIHDDATRTEFKKLADQARKEGLESAAKMIEGWAEVRDTGKTKAATIEDAKRVLNDFRQRADLENRKSKNIPYPEELRTKLDPSEETLVDIIQSGYTRDRWNKLPEDVKKAALSAWEKQVAIYNKYGYYPEGFSRNISEPGIESIQISLSKYISALLSKDKTKSEERIKAELDNIKRTIEGINELYAKEGFEGLKKEEISKPVVKPEPFVPETAKPKLDKFKQKQVSEALPESEKVSETVIATPQGMRETDVQSVPLSNLTTDESRFQNRAELNEVIVNEIAKNWSDKDQDPIHVWTDPKDGKTYVLSGHHRYYGAQRANRPTVKIIDRTNDFTEAQAIKFAKEEANANRSMETPIERAKALRRKIESGDSKEEINRFLDREGKNRVFVSNLASLNPNGLMMNTLVQLGKSPDIQTQKETEQRADWIGEARRTINGLTDAHEAEMYNFLFDKKQSQRITTKADFLQKVRSSVKPLTPEEPLNLSRFEYKTEGESAYEEEVSNLKDKINSKQSDINSINERFTNPASKDYIPTSSKDYAKARELADNKIAALDAERKSLQKQLETLYTNKSKYTGGPATGSLFSVEKVTPEDVRDMTDAVADFIKESPEMSLREVQSSIASYTGDNSPAMAKLVATAYEEAKNNATDEIVKNPVIRRLNRAFLKIDTEILENSAQLSDMAKRLANARFNAIENSAGYETRDGKPIGFTYDTDKVARERFDISNLKKLGEGSDRVVFDLGNGKVLKVAKTARGLEQNVYEGDSYLSIVPDVYERGLNYVVVENVPRIKGSDIVPIYDPATGQEIGSTTAAQMIKDLGKFWQSDFDRRNQDLQDVIAKYGFEDVLSYDLLYRDFAAGRNWGYKDGRPVHIDGGTFGGVQMLDNYRGKTNLSDPDFRRVYEESRRLKKQFADTDKYTKFHYDENGEILGFTHNGKIYLNGQKVTAKTTAEESGHIWINNTKETNPELYKAGLDKVIGSKYLSEVSSSNFYTKEALKQGPKGSVAYENYLKEEALAKAIADQGAKFVTDAQKINFKNWVMSMWRNVIKSFGIKNLNPDEVAKLTLEEFARMAAADVYAKEKKGAKAEKESPSVQAAKEEAITIRTKHPYLYTSETQEQRTAGLMRNILESENVSDETKNEIKAQGLTKYKISSNSKAQDVANEMIATFGKRDALTIARGRDVHPSVRSAMFARLIDMAYESEKKATTVGAKLAAAQEWKSLAEEYSNELTAGGQFTAYAGHYYRISPMGFVMKENAENERRFDDWMIGKEKDYEQLWQELNQTAEGSQLVEAKLEEIRKQERKEARAKREKNIDDFFDNAKIKGGTYSVIIPPAVWNGAMEGLKIATKAGVIIADAVQEAINEISKAIGDNWDKEKFRNEYESKLSKIADEGKKEMPNINTLEARIKSLEKQIENYKEKIAKGGEPGTKKELKFSDDPDVQRLIEERDQLKKENERLLKEAGVGKYSDEARNIAAQKAAQKGIDEIQKKLDENDLEIQQAQRLNETQKTKDLREKRSELAKELENRRKEAQIGKYSEAEKAKAEAKRKQDAIDELNRRINQKDFSSEVYKARKAKDALQLELDETRKAYKEARKTSPEWQEKKAMQFLDKFRDRLKGLNEKEKKEVVSRSIKQIAETGGLKYDDLRKIVAETIGIKDLTGEDVKEIEYLVERINSVEAAEEKLVNDPTEANLRALEKARQDSMESAMRLRNKMHRPADIVGFVNSMTAGSLLGAITLFKNFYQNIALQKLGRFPVSLYVQAGELGAYGLSWIGNKTLGSKIYQPTKNIILAQKGFFGKGKQGVKRGWFNFYKGVQERDYFGKTSYQSTIAPKEALKDIKMWRAGEKYLTKTEIAERYLRASLGWQADFILRAMSFGDKPQRWAAEGAAAIQIARLELKLFADNEVNAFMAAPKAFATKVLIDRGIAKEDAIRMATEFEERIINAGSRAVMEQDNLLSYASKAIDQKLKSTKQDTLGWKAIKGGAAILKGMQYPFVKIPANVYWQMYKMANPEVSLAQAVYHAGEMIFYAKKGDRAAQRRASENVKESLGMAAYGYSIKLAIASLVASGYVSPPNDEETTARERAGESTEKAKGNQINLGKLMGGHDYWVDLQWFGPIGTAMGVEAKIQQKNKQKELKGEEVDKSYLAGLSNHLSEAGMEAMNDLVFNQSADMISAMKNGGSYWNAFAAKQLGTVSNWFTGATVTAVTKASLPYEPRLKAESTWQEINNNMKYRNFVWRLVAGRPPAKVSVWGDKITRDTSVTGILQNLLGFSPDDNTKFGAILLRDFMRTQDPRFFPMPEDNKITVDGESVEVSEEEKAALETYVGNARKTLVQAFVYDMSMPYKVPIRSKKGILNGNTGSYYQYANGVVFSPDMFEKQIPVNNIKDLSEIAGDKEGTHWESMKYNDPRFPDSEKVKALDKIYKYGREIGEEQFRTKFPAFAVAKINPQQMVYKGQENIWNLLFKIQMQKIALPKGTKAPELTPEEQKLVDEMQQFSEQQRQAEKEAEEALLMEQEKENEENENQ